MRVTPDMWDGFMGELKKEAWAPLRASLAKMRPGGMHLPRLGAGKNFMGAHPFSGNKVQPLQRLTSPLFTSRPA